MKSRKNEKEKLQLRQFHILSHKMYIRRITYPWSCQICNLYALVLRLCGVIGASLHAVGHFYKIAILTSSGGIAGLLNVLFCCYCWLFVMIT